MRRTDYENTNHQVVEIGTKESGSSQSNASQDQKIHQTKLKILKDKVKRIQLEVQDPKDQANRIRCC